MTLDAARVAATRTADSDISGAPTTLSQARDQYVESPEFKALAHRTQVSYRNVLKHEDLRQLMTRKARQVTRADLLAVKDAISAAGRVPANTLRVVGALMAWCLDRQLIDSNPALRLKLAQSEADPKPFTDEEVGHMVAALEDQTPEPIRTLGLLVAYTGARPATWTDAEWAEIDLKRARLTVSRSRGRKTKLGRGWAIPLARQCVELLRAMRDEQGRRATAHLFGRKLVVEQKARDRLAKAAGLTEESSRG